MPGRNLNALGNAYHLEMTYEPSGQRVTSLAEPGTLLLEVPDIARYEFVSPDGRQWSPLPARALVSRRRSLTATLRVPGYYVAATDGPTLEFRARRSSHAALVVALVVVLVALLVFLGVFLAKPERKPNKPRAAR